MCQLVFVKTGPETRAICLNVLMLLMVNLFLKQCIAQSFTDFEVVAFENESQVSAIEISPDKKMMALGTAGGPVFFWDIATQKVVRQIDIDGYSQGPYMHFSDDGKYLLLLQQFYTKFTLNNDLPARAEVLDVAAGKILISKNGLNTAMFGTDNKSMIGLQDGEVIFWNILSGEVERKFKPEQVSNAIALSRVANLIAVSQKPTEADLKNIPSIRDDKKAKKKALKYREVVAFYDSRTLEKKLVVSDIFDIVFNMSFSDDGSTLYLFNAPNTNLRAQNGAERNGYIQSVNVANGTSNRTIFPTSANEPQYKESADKFYFAATSIEPRFRILHSVNLFERENGFMKKNFILDFRVGEDIHAGRAAFEFFPDGKKMLVGYGSRLAIWKIE